jgi:hypothetical protein
MDALSSQLWSVFLNVVGNRVDALIFGRKEKHDASAQVSSLDDPVPGEELGPAEQKSSRRFNTFDARHDIERFLSYVQEPIVHLLVEDSPSTHYNLPGYVLQSNVTGEWFVFSRGRLSLQGTGGGHHNMEAVADILTQKRTTIVGWVIQKEAMDDLERGVLLWPDAKRSIVPLPAFHSDDPVWLGIKRQFDELARKAV